MGLDMYLSMRFNTRKEEGFVVPVCEGDDCLMRLSIGYWRKANAVHKWFVENVQGNKDECQECEVMIADLEKLRGICEGIVAKATECGVASGVDFDDELPEALRDYCASVLPSSSGFFFGGTEYDGYYLWQVFNTQKIIDAAFLLIEHNYLYTFDDNREKKYLCKLFYQSSW